MSDLMLLSVLRMPVTPQSDELTITQYINRGRQAADLIEQQQKRIAELEATVERLRSISEAEYADEDERIADIQGVLESTPQQNLAEQHPDDEAVNKFAYQMKCKLAIARSKGRSGWDNPDLCSVASLIGMLVGHLRKSNIDNWVDIANFCMMLHLRCAEPIYLASALAEHDAEVARKAFIDGSTDAAAFISQQLRLGKTDIDLFAGAAADKYVKTKYPSDNDDGK